MKKCPYCAEEIKDEAIFCRYCRRDLVEKPWIVRDMEKRDLEKLQAQQAKKGNHTGLVLVLVVLGIILLGVIFIYRFSDTYGGSVDGGDSGGEENVADSEKEDNVGDIISALDFVEVVPDTVHCKEEYGYMTITGLVWNKSTKYDLQFVEVRGTALSPYGTVKNTNTSYIDSDILYADSTSTFEIMVKARRPLNGENTCRATIEDASFK